MRDNVRAFVEIAAAAFPLEGPVFEFGSYLVEGQEGHGDLRSLFPGRRFVGCDLREGPGVDRIEDLARLSLPSGSARTVLCLDTLEHVFEARRAVDEMIRVLAPGGILLITAPMDFRIHNHPDDYWRLTPACMGRLLAPLAATVIGSQGVENHPHTVFGIGCKTPASDRFARGASRLIDGFQAWLERQAAEMPLADRVKYAVTGWARSKGERRRRKDYCSARFAVHLPAPAAAAPPLGLSLEPTLVGSRVDCC